MGLPNLSQRSRDTSLNKNVPPGPQGSPLWGSLREFQADSIGFLTESVREYGDIIRLRFGPVVAYLLNRPEHVEHVLARHSQRYDKNTRSVAKLRATCGGSLLSSDGERWLRHRRLIQPVFQPHRVAEFVHAIDSSTEEMLASWNVKASVGQEVDIVAEMMGLTLTVAARAFFSSDIREQTAVIDKALEVVLQDTWRRLQAPMDLAAISPVFQRRKFRQAMREIDEVVYRIIGQRRQCRAGTNDLLSRLLRAHESETDTRLTDQELRDAVVTLLLAGHETTANALASTFYLVSKSEPIQDRLVEEARQPALAVLPEACKAFWEAIRMYPSIWIMERHAVADDQIGGYPIRKGSTVLLSPYLLHRHAEFWQTPNQYDPDRFTPDRIAARPRCAYIPFGLGQHRCIGEHMALLVATRILSRVHRDFRLHLVAGQVIQPVPGITLRHDGPLWMTLRRVEQDAAERYEHRWDP